MAELKGWTSVGDKVFGTYGSGTAPTIQAIITVATGPYRGVLAQKMGQ